MIRDARGMVTRSHLSQSHYLAVPDSATKQSYPSHDAMGWKYGDMIPIHRQECSFSVIGVSGQDKPLFSSFLRAETISLQHSFPGVADLTPIVHTHSTHRARAGVPQIAKLSRIAERTCTTRLTLAFTDRKNTERTLKESCRDNKQ